MVGSLEAFGQGFSSFYSIWQACVAQISPFFLAYALGLYFTAYSPAALPSIPKRTLAPSLVYMTGFSILYALMTAIGSPVGRFLAYNSQAFSFAAGIVILLISLFFILHGRAAFIIRIDRPAYIAAMSALTGIAFALVYSPCITPTLSRIMGIAARPETAIKGAFLAFYYGLGLSLAFLTAGVVMVAVSSPIGALTRNPGRVKDVCGVIIGVLAALNVTGQMISYKAFILGFLVK